MTAPHRNTYHHGDARAALVQAAFDLARTGGPPTVTLRAAARHVGITAAAVYRHFTTVEELLDVVKRQALRLLAERLDEAVALSEGEGEGEGELSALDRTRAIAEAYLSFAREHPGLFAMACHGGLTAARELVADRVAGAPRPTRLAVWSAAHGVAALTVSEAEQRQVLDILLSGIVVA
ncbi:TetR/AcrR family transcriptional regulator [Catenulispora sp. NL8]|uniref:TetR/AcrR family transcriptional regulator n=1 Tax=Catenulispora pinistramenti TaxID=2705254 RepID=A0ABS5KXM0_9ACTN|nr:TetR/AcrR family transcriptional regulator [Catenulispora pinistramenti]MBS2550807.1 TetR/AcrR family transcriptional regulator [Catenulispora pinistramenti]